jgi:LysR family nitrogen assimilation transcriptional regulator
LNVALEVPSVQSVLELVAAGHGYGVLAQTALAVSGRPQAFRLPISKRDS